MPIAAWMMALWHLALHVISFWETAEDFEQGFHDQ